MQTAKVNIADLQHPERNVRRHPQKQIQEMKRSLEMFGQFRPIVVDENNVILAGNGMLVAMKELGYEQAEVLRYDNLTENQKKKLMIADNQIASLGVDDYQAIEDLIKELGDELDIPGYDDDTLKMIVAESDSAVEQVMSYGTYQPEAVQGMKNLEQDRSENGFQPVEQTYSPNEGQHEQRAYQPQPEPVAYQPGRDSGDEGAADVRRFVICPHCGEKVYIN